MGPTPMRAGFVLIGGKSTRMGRDKALLPCEGRTLAETVAATVAEAAGSVTLIGDPMIYAHLPFPIIADERKDCGPLGGIATALAVSTAPWNLITACDMPALTVPFLRTLLEAAEASDADCLLPVGPSGLPEPLCAAYHRRSLPVIRKALEDGVRKVVDALAGLRVQNWKVLEEKHLVNTNTPAEWAESQHG
jgi:molybdenum cofactor guanylyltransferase